MHLFVSDIHLGRCDPATERQVEVALIDCIRYHRNTLEHLYLLGDLFDEYIEYQYLIPKSGLRLMNLLAELVESGVGVTYLVGNHDPWHRDFFHSELGVRLSTDPLQVDIDGMRVHLEHGDGIESGSLYSRIKPILRHPVPVWIYRSLLPGDSGFRLARWYNRTFGHGEVKPLAAEEIAQHAVNLIQRGEANLVVMGHTHQARLVQLPDGVYLNTGYWHEARTFGILDSEGIHLRRWNGTCSEDLNSCQISAEKAAQCS